MHFLLRHDTLAKWESNNPILMNAEIVICGALHIKINEDTACWIPPTAEQKENLKKLLNIEVFEYGDKAEER